MEKPQRIRFLAVASPRDMWQQISDEAAVVVASGQRCCIWVRDQAQAARLDQHLWQFEAASLLPHAVWPCSLILHPIVLTWQPLILPHTNHLIVAHPHPTEPPEVFSWMLAYPHILEFVDLSDKYLQAQSRLRFRTWRQYDIQPLYEKSPALEEPPPPQEPPPHPYDY